MIECALRKMPRNETDRPMPDYYRKCLTGISCNQLYGIVNCRLKSLLYLLLASILPIPALAAGSASYLDSQARFADISNPEQQAEAWAVCAAAYDVMSTIMRETSPDRARQLHNLANGAQVSIGMTLVSASIDASTDAERFSELWVAHESAMVDLPQQKLADILEEGEDLGDERAEDFGRKINATVFTCIDNLDTQRDYVESWQKLAEKGLVQPPED